MGSIYFKLNDTSGAGASLRRIIEFLAGNLETILNIVIRVGQAFVIYKATMLAINATTKIYNGLLLLQTNGLKSLLINQTAATKGAATATTTQKGLNLAMKAMPFAIVISGLATIASSLGLFETRTEAALRRQEELNAAMEDGYKAAEKLNEQSNKKTNKILEEQTALTKQKVNGMIAEGKTSKEISKELEKIAAQTRFQLIQERKEISKKIEALQIQYKTQKN